ncbi:MAG: sulfatase [Verrucomicrobia bacterium]|nr:sulfatase [Verrucomicrobiota bacterium]
MIERAILLCALFLGGAGPVLGGERPNLLFILADDLGFGDLGCQGAVGIRTPNLDRLAREGSRFTSYYVCQAVCTASRASLMSGCHANRIGLHGALNHTSRNGIHPEEWLLPEMLREQGYATACIGKWHLGTVAEFNPLRNGFDQWFGLPYSNDNSKYHPVLAAEMPPLPLYDGDDVIELDPDQSRFTRRFTERALAFLKASRERPFFLYLAHVMPHVPIFASDAFKGRSGRGLYGDVVEELDDSVGQILTALDRLGLAKDTIVVFSSDNGAWLSYGEHAGSNGPFREGKLTCFEGGVRVPLLIRWPGRIPSGRVSDVPFMSIDWLPTFTELAAGRPPALTIDGVSVAPLLTGASGSPPHEALFFYAGEELHAVRSGQYKLHLPHPYLTTAGEPGRGGKPSEWGKTTPVAITDSSMGAIASRHGQKVAETGLSLYDLSVDPGEQRNVAQDHPEVVRRLLTMADSVRAELGDRLTGMAGSGCRESGRKSL